MPLIEFSQEDILRSKLVEPAWYRVQVTDADEKIASTGTSTNFNMKGTILFNADTGDKEFAGVPIYWNFNSKAMGFAVGFVQGLGQEVTPGSRFDLDATKGKTLDIFVERGEWNNQPRNQVNHKYRVAREG